MRICVSLLTLALVALSAVTRADHLATDFSSTNNPNGNWRFGWRNPPINTFQNVYSSATTVTGVTGTMTYWRDPATPFAGVYKSLGPADFVGNEGTTIRAGEVMIHPQSGIVALARWIVPIAGTYRVVTQLKRCGGQDGLTRFHLVTSGANTYQEDVTLRTGYQPPRNHSLILTTGDLLDFVVDRGDSSLAHDSTGVRAGVYRVDEIQFAPVTAISTIEGEEFQGDLSSVQSSNNDHYTAFNDAATLGCTIELQGAGSLENATCLWFRYESKVDRVGLAEEVQFFDFVSNQWVFAYGRVAPTIDSVSIITVLAGASRYVGGFGLTAARIRWAPINDEDPAQDGWLHGLDEANWETAL